VGGDTFLMSSTTFLGVWGGDAPQQRWIVGILLRPSPANEQFSMGTLSLANSWIKYARLSTHSEAWPALGLVGDDYWLRSSHLKICRMLHLPLPVSLGVFTPHSAQRARHPPLTTEGTRQPIVALNSGHVSGSGDAGDDTAHGVSICNGVSIDYVWRVQSESSAHCSSRNHATEPHCADIVYFPSLALFYKPVFRDKERCPSAPSSDPLSSIVPSFQYTLKASLNLPRPHHQLLHKSYRQNP
jgi:hypothetical protein